jgi:hypothetical protein
MKKNLHFKNAFKTLFLLSLSCCVIFVACKKSSNNIDPVVSKTGNFSANVAGAVVNGSEFSDESYITTNDEFLEVPYAEIHLAGGNNMIDIMITNPTVKQYTTGGSSTEAGITFSVNGTVYAATSTSVLKITEATASKISGTISGTFLNTNTNATVQVTDGSFTAQF